MGYIGLILGLYWGYIGRILDVIWGYMRVILGLDEDSCMAQRSTRNMEVRNRARTDQLSHTTYLHDSRNWFAAKGPKIPQFDNPVAYCIALVR